MEAKSTKRCKKRAHIMTPERTYRYQCRECIKIDDQERYEKTKEMRKEKYRQERLDLLAYRALMNTSTTDRRK